MGGPLHASQSTSSQEQLDLCLYVPTDEQSTLVTTDHPRSLDHGDTGSTQGETCPLAQDCGYSSSASSTGRTSSDVLNRTHDYEDLADGGSRPSSRSSVYSIPASVLANSPDGPKSAIVRRPHPDIIPSSWNDHETEPGIIEEHLKLVPTMRKQHGVFRKSSSVRAMQMHTEGESDDEYLTPPKRRGCRRSDMSVQPPGPSPLKRSPYYSPPVPEKIQKPKDYPLVLLHCNLLPPTLPIPGFTGYPDPKVVREVLPPEYWKRWKLLEEKIGSVVLRERGVLISHPEDMYDLLEERLLESLELQRPRLDHGHFLSHDETDIDKEDGSVVDESATDDEQGEQCPDCGGHVIQHSDTRRKWEIRVFAANGLMKAGAWAAAWKGMEKVDVEIGLWLPSELRRELENRMLESERSHAGGRLQQSQTQPQVNDVPSSHLVCSQPPATPNAAPAHLTPKKVEKSRSLSPQNVVSEKNLGPKRPSHTPDPAEIELQTLLVNYIRVLASDRRNVAIAFLTVLVAFFAMTSRPPRAASELRPFPPEMLDNPPRPSISAVPLSPAGWADSTSSVQEMLESAEESAAYASSPCHGPSSASNSMGSSITNVWHTSTSTVDFGGPEDVLEEPGPTEMAGIATGIPGEAQCSAGPTDLYNVPRLATKEYTVGLTEQVYPEQARLSKTLTIIQ
ncbi:hypothetical protein BDV25DRAFT_161518 [Aspergillus avenaceus]|uniref:Flavoprotein oxygenase n=1 Tax=Aspergillus avenaceus TaxID=36643 RepID=A0A5N6TKM0_ASPAV|nr:hypothetical protein BDV25DRAFT_161518 [Aspergillus avenaceus]